MVMYDYDKNAILQRAVKSRQAVDAFISMVDELTIVVVKPKLFILDNEMSGKLCSRKIYPNIQTSFFGHSC